MSKTRQILENITERPAQPQMSPEDTAMLQKIKRDRARIAGYHPGDDSPFAGFADGYSGYTVSDSRAHMTRIKQDIEAKYGITHEPSPAAYARQAEKDKFKHDTRRSVDKQIKQQFPLYDKVQNIMFASRYGSERRQIRNLLTRAGFANISAAAKYYAQANKVKGELLVKAGLRKRY
jgi:hypothetical protein